MSLLLASSPLSAATSIPAGDAPGSAIYMLALMASLVVAAAAHFLRRRTHKWSPQSLWSCVAAYVIGLSAFVWGSSQLPDGALAIAGLATGIGAVPLVLLASEAFSRRDLTANLALVGSSQLVIGVAGLLCARAEETCARVIVSLGLALGLALLALATHARDVTFEGEKAHGASHSIRDAMVALFPVMGIPLLGVFAYAVFVKPSFGLAVSQPQMLGLDKELLLYAVAAVALLAVGIARPRGPIYASAYRTAVPIGIIAILVFQSFPYASTPHGWASTLSILLTALLMQFAVAVVLTVVGSREHPPSFVICPFLMVYGLGRLGSIGLQVLAVGFPDGEYALYQIVMTFILSLMIVFVLLQYRGQNKASEKEAGIASPSIAQAVEAACDRLSQAHKLTIREAEVFRLLARGYAPAYIADVLVLSDSTVRTHAKAIYRKIGVSSREELLTLVDSAAD